VCVYVCFTETSRVGLHDDVFWLDVAMNEVKRMDVLERLEHLLHDELETRHHEIRGLAALAKRATKFVQVFSKQLRHDEKMLLMCVRVCVCAIVIVLVLCACAR